MKSCTKFITLILVLAIFQFGCSSEETTKVSSLDDDALIGTWRLIKTIEIGHEDSTNRRDGEDKYYIKHINDSHFIWVEYDRKNNQLLGTGGGTYTLENNVYTEDIAFYYPPGSNEAGQAIPFKAEINDEGIWRHTGYAKLMEFDPETADIVMVDSAIIDEMWERVESPSDDDTSGQLMGSWEFVNYLDQNDSTYNEYPPFYGSIKLMTPTHFTYIHYNTEADEIFALGGGPYTVSGDTYTEHIEYVHPQNEDQIGVDAVYTWKLEDGGIWNISGSIQYQESPQNLEENWAKFEGEGVNGSPTVGSN